MNNRGEQSSPDTKDNSRNTPEQTPGGLVSFYSYWSNSSAQQQEEHLVTFFVICGILRRAFRTTGRVALSLSRRVSGENRSIIWWIHVIPY